MKFGTDSHDAQRLNPNNSGNPMTFNLAPLASQNSFIVP